MLNSEDKKAGDVVARNDLSLKWMEDNYYEEWESVFKAYRCERDPEKDDDGRDDSSLTSIATPLTTAYTNRATARMTAQPPNVRFRAKDKGYAELISRTLMYQWDKAKVQRQQKRHVRQAVLFGWSVRAWYWSFEEYNRQSRYDPYNDSRPQALDAITNAYGDQIVQEFGVPYQMLPPEQQPVALTMLLEKYGRGGLLDVKEPYKAYEGPKCDFLSVADCFPEPNFTSIQESEWFQVERRRNKNWIDMAVKAYPDLADGFDRLLKKYPKGAPPHYQSGQTGRSQNFRTRMANAFSGNRFNHEFYDTAHQLGWSIIEEHIPGPNPKLRLVGEKDTWIGEIPYPYELEGKIAFTDLILIDDFLGGVGESLPRFFRGLQKLYDRQVNVRWDLIYNILRPLIGTTNREFYEDPKKIARGPGFRLVYMRGPNDLWVQGEQAAMASAAAGIQDSGGIMSLFQMITGENNMSLQANADPQQGKTATGARILAYIGDIISKDLIDMFTETSLKADAEMMFMLNRSEMTEQHEFEASRYNRVFDVKNDPLKEQWMKVEPLHFQTDGEIMVEVGSTLADDDEMRAQKALQMYGAATARPDLFNQQKARDEFVKAMGFGKELNEWAAPPPQPPPPQPPKPAQLSVSAKLETLREEVQLQVLEQSGIKVQPQPPQPMPPGMQGGMPPSPAGGGPGIPPPASGPPPNEDGGMLIPEEQLAGAGAYAASRGRNPLS